MSALFLSCQSISGFMQLTAREKRKNYIGFPHRCNLCSLNSFKRLYSPAHNPSNHCVSCKAIAPSHQRIQKKLPHTDHYSCKSEFFWCTFCRLNIQEFQVFKFFIIRVLEKLIPPIKAMDEFFEYLIFLIFFVCFKEWH